MKISTENVLSRLMEPSGWLRKTFGKRIPILQWIRHYTREDAIGDVIAGITISLMTVPQSIAYAALAGLDPQYGLNSAFVGTFIYVFFGTVKQVVIGPSSLMALLTIEYTRHLNVDFVILLTFLCGIAEIAMGIFQLGFLVGFISTPVVSGFTSATALIVVISQMKGLLGLKIETKGMANTIYELIKHSRELKFGDTVLGVTSIVVLLSLRRIKDVQVSDKLPKPHIIKKILWFISTGRNALIVFITSYIAYLYSQGDQGIPFVTTKKVTSGVPSFRLPPVSTQIGNTTYDFPEMLNELAPSFFVIPVIAVLANVAIAKAFISGRVDATQEMVALSLCNIFGSFFQSMPTCGAFSRSAVINASGVRTPLAGLYSAGLTLLALQFLSPFFHYIPRATLAAVLMSAVMFLVDYEILRPLWRTSKLDFWTLVGTFTVCLLVGVQIGLFFGILVGLGNLIQKWTRPKTVVERKTTSTGGYILVTPQIDLFFPAVDQLTDVIIQTAEDDPDKLPILLNCSQIRGTDFTVAKTLISLNETLGKIGRRLILVEVRPKCKKIWSSAGCPEALFISPPNLGQFEIEGSLRLTEITSDKADNNGELLEISKHFGN